MNRETWLNALAAKMAPRFEELGHPLPAFRVSIGWTSGGRSSRANGECWSPTRSADRHFEIFIAVTEDSTTMIAAILAHELTHAAVGLAEGHKGKFATVLAALGLKRPFTSSVPTPAFEAWVAPFVDELGAVPHARLTPSAPAARVAPAARAPGVDQDDDSDDDSEREDAPPEPDSSRPRKQGTRMLKAACEDCGYTVRVTAKWLEIGPPHCPQHGAMGLEQGA